MEELKILQKTYDMIKYGNQYEGKTAEEILLEYPALTDEEKAEIIAAL